MHHLCSLSKTSHQTLFRLPRVAFSTEPTEKDNASLLAEMKQRLLKASVDSSNEIPLADFMHYLRNKILLESHPQLLSIILVQFFKRLLRNEGIEGEHDDIFRPIYASQRAKVSKIIVNKQEVVDAINTLLNKHLEDIEYDKL
jgi:hypothetical protein